MLAELHLENLGVIERLDVIFGEAMTAVTGETGAGKTLIVEAIELLVGGRADTSMIRSGASEARVDGRFVTADGAETIVSRVIPVNGRSRAYVNGRPSTVAVIAETCRPLVDLHGQHAHQSLLSPATQRAAVDRFGGIDLAPLRAARQELAQIEAELYSLGGDERERVREIDLLRYQVAELTDAGLSDADEDARLMLTEDALADAVAHREAGLEALESLSADGGGRESVAGVVAAIGDRGPYREVAQRLSGLLAELDDAISDLRDVVEGVEENPQQLDQIRQRRQRLAELRRKYGANLAEVIAYADEARQRLAELESFEERAAALELERDRAREALSAAAVEVGRKRRDIAPALAQRVQERLRELALPAAQVEFRAPDVSSDPAADGIELLFAANPDSDAQPLAKVASGGELARTMLALRLVLMATPGSRGHGEVQPVESETHQEPGTLVFDEVDAGLGGAAAVAVGQALARLGRAHQVFVVTHLAQVAAGADRQVVVTKSVRDSRTHVAAVTLDGDDRIDEMARMLAGSVTDTARRHAAELLATSAPDRSA